MMRSTLLVLLTVLAAAGYPGMAAELSGFNPDSVRAQLDTPPPVLSNAARERALRLDRVAQALRLNLAADPGQLLGMLDEEERMIARSVLNLGSPAGWRWFFSGSIVLVGAVESNTVRVGYYNPLADGIVLADLMDAGSSFRLSGMHAMTGAMLRGKAPDEAGMLVPVWARNQDLPVPISLVDVAGATALAFEERYPLSATSLDAIDSTGDITVADRASANVLLLATVTTDPGWASALAAFDERLAPGRDVIRHPAVDELPEVARDDLRLTGLLRGRQDSIAVFVSPAAPRLLLFVDVSGGSDGNRPLIGSAALVDVLATREGDQ